MTLFVDTSVLYGAADRSDRWNARAKEILAAGEPLVTSDHVLVETWLLAERRLGMDIAERLWEGVKRSGCALEPATAADLEVAWAIGEAFADQGFSIADRTSFAVMQRLGLTKVAT